MQAANDTISRAAVTVTPFSPNGDGIRDSTALKVSLRRRAAVTVTVRDFQGRVVRTLASGRSLGAGTHTFTWWGRGDDRRLVANAGYRFRADAVNALGTARAVVPVTVSRFVVYPARPGLITVAVDPGHGRPDPGAYYSGYREATFNLDIAFRLRAMLAGARVNVLLTRDRDEWLNVPLTDRTGDGVIDRNDDLQARLDFVNPARPDLMVVLMNNAYLCHCVKGTETFTNANRTWTPQATALGQLLQQEHMRVLAAYRTATWQPTDRGVRYHDKFYQMRPYQPGVPRPSFMVTVLGESLFMDQAQELELLKRPRVRQSIAEAYYNAIARYLNGRLYGVRYAIAAAPRTAAAGTTVTYRLGVANRGNASSSGWRLELRYVPAVPLYDGSGRRGVLLRSVAVPAIGRGQTTTLTVDARAPASVGRWLVKADIRLPDGSYLSDRGVVTAQIPLATTTSSPSATPRPSPSASPSASARPSASPSASAPPSASASASAAPSGSSATPSLSTSPDTSASAPPEPSLSAPPDASASASPEPSPSAAPDASVSDTPHPTASDPADPSAPPAPSDSPASEATSGTENTSSPSGPARQGLAPEGGGGGFAAPERMQLSGALTHGTSHLSAEIRSSYESLPMCTIP